MAFGAGVPKITEKEKAAAQKAAADLALTKDLRNWATSVGLSPTLTLDEIAKLKREGYTKPPAGLFGDVGKSIGAVVEKGLEGTPFANVGGAVNSALKGDLANAGKKLGAAVIDNIVANTPLSNVPFIGVLKETTNSAILGNVDGAVKAAMNGVTQKVVPSVFSPQVAAAINSSIMPATRATPAPLPPAPPLPPIQSAAVAMQALAGVVKVSDKVQQPGAPANPKPAQATPLNQGAPVKKFTKEEWKAYAVQPETVGGTQPALRLLR